jgi:hypothetical protein
MKCRRKEAVRESRRKGQRKEQKREREQQTNVVKQLVIQTRTSGLQVVSQESGGIKLWG